MKLKHNKKRNTALLYEALIKELTKATIQKNEQKKGRLIALIREHFNKNTLLKKELELYKTLHDEQDLTPYTAEKLIFEVRKAYAILDKKQLFNEQSALIKKINKMFSKSIFSNFIPSYKNFATINQIFDDNISIKKRVLLEENLIFKLSKSAATSENQKLKPIDNIIYGTFVEKFNKEYSKILFVEQKELLAKYISSFSENGLQLKIYLNEEIDRLKTVVQESLKLDDVEKDPVMVGKTKEVLELLENFQEETIDNKMIKKVLQIQNLVREIGSKENGNSN